MRARPSLPPAAWIVGGTVAPSVCVGAIASTESGQRAAAALVLGLLVAALCFRAPRAVLVAIALWLPLLGFLRRLLTGADGEAVTSDPLLLVAPLAAVVILLVAAAAGAFDRMTPLSWAVLTLSVMTAVFAVHPLTPPSLVAPGLLFITVPLLWFWAGRALVSDRLLRRLLVLAAVLAVLASVYGLYQTFVAFPPWDQNWIDTSGYAALRVGENTRAFASFSAASEYAYYLAAGAVLVLTLARPRWIWLTLPLALLIVVALVFESSRGVMFMLTITLAVLACVRMRLSVPASIVVACLALVALVGLMSAVAPTTYGGQTGDLLEHQLAGLADPLNPEKTTFRQHQALVEQGLSGLPSAPLGHGTGTITGTAQRYDASKGTETDPSNVAVAMGFPGLVVYLAVFGLGLAYAHRLAVSRRDALSLAAMGVVFVTALQWMNGGQYAVAALVWLVLGWIDAAWRDRRSAATPARPGA